MASTPHTSGQRTKMQAERTAAISGAATHASLGQGAVSAWLADRARELKLVNDRETPQTPLS